MSSGFTPVNQVRLTNVAYVRLQKGGKKFEIACYRNKVVSWRNKAETDINEVLQIDSIFANVSKGMLASSKDVLKAFGTTDQKQVCMEILNRGELQISEQERVALQETVFKDIASIVVEKTVNTETNRAYTVNIIQNAMKEIQYSVNLSKSSKSQALEVIRRLKENNMPIERTKMTLRIHYKSRDRGTLDGMLSDVGNVVIFNRSGSVVGKSDDADSCYVDVRIYPESYRVIESSIEALRIDGMRSEILQLLRTAPSSDDATAVAIVTAVAAVDSSMVISQPHCNSSASDGEADTERIGVHSQPSGTTSSQGCPSTNNADDDDRSDHDPAESEEESSGGEDHPFDKPYIVDRRKQKLLDKKRRKELKKGSRVGEDAAPEEAPTSSLAGDGFRAAAVEVVAPVANKVSKRSKRIEKEALLEKQAKMDKLQSRIESDSMRLRNLQISSRGDDGSSTTTTTVVMNTSNPASAFHSHSHSTSTKQHHAVAATGNNRNGEKSHQQLVDMLTKSYADTHHLPSPQQRPVESSSHQHSDSSSTQKAQSCNTCGGCFPDAIHYRMHFRSEWHRFNLNRKLLQLPCLAEEEFVVAEGLSVTTT